MLNKTSHASSTLKANNVTNFILEDFSYIIVTEESLHE